jgi:hypothetical protein
MDFIALFKAADIELLILNIAFAATEENSQRGSSSFEFPSCLSARFERYASLDETYLEWAPGVSTARLNSAYHHW